MNRSRCTKCRIWTVREGVWRVMLYRIQYIRWIMAEWGGLAAHILHFVQDISMYKA